MWVLQYIVNTYDLSSLEYNNLKKASLPLNHVTQILMFHHTKHFKDWQSCIMQQYNSRPAH